LTSEPRMADAGDMADETRTSETSETSAASETTTSSPTTRRRAGLEAAERIRRMPAWQRNTLALVLFAVLLWVVSWMGGRAADRRELEARRTGVDSLAAVLAANFVPGDANRARRTVDALARTGWYTRVILLDAEGGVAASTDRLAEPGAFGAPETWPAQATAKRRAGRWVVQRAVEAPDAARQGLLVVEIAID